MLFRIDLRIAAKRRQGSLNLVLRRRNAIACCILIAVRLFETEREADALGGQLLLTRILSLEKRHFALGFLQFGLGLGKLRPQVGDVGANQIEFGLRLIERQT